MIDITPTSERAPITHNDNVLAEGFYSLESQSYDYITNNSITVRESMYNEMTREKTMAEQKEIEIRNEKDLTLKQIAHL